MNVDIYFDNFIREDGVEIGGGGIGTQLAFLCPLLDELGYTTTVYQSHPKHTQIKFKGATVIGVPDYPGPNRPTEEVVKHFRAIAKERTPHAERIEIFAADFFSIRNDNPLAISIMQGLSWDAPIEILTAKRMFRTAIGEKVLRFRKQLQGLEKFENCYNRVVADLSFLNWYRSFRGPQYEGKVLYNPNPAITTPWDTSRDSMSGNAPVRIIFARRLVPEKGTRMAIEVFKEILLLYPNIEITIAGEGEDKPLLEQTFANEPRVIVAAYKTEEATEFHKHFDIAFVPSICGEATSFSILEAMSAGCAVVASNMFGIITEIIPMHNGVLCFPIKESLLQGMKYLIENPVERLKMQKNAWMVAQRSFSIEQWRNGWKVILEEVVEGREYARKCLRKRSKRFHYLM